MLYSGSLVEVIEADENAPHPTEPRSLEVRDRFLINAVTDDEVFYLSIYTTGRIDLSKVKEVPTVGKGVARDSLQVTYAIQDQWFVFQKDSGMVLCQGVRPSLSEHRLYLPVIFKNYDAAEKWVKDGCIAEIQEGSGNLDIRFTKALVVSPKPIWSEEEKPESNPGQTYGKVPKHGYGPGSHS